ncbi:MAG: DEAD/DEAH box helicase [Planctomycetota bacterium]
MISFEKLPQFSKLIKVINTTTDINIGGLTASAAALLVAELTARINLPIIVITRGEHEALRFSEDTELFTKVTQQAEAKESVFHLPALLDPVDDIESNMRLAALRLTIVKKISELENNRIISVCSMRAASQPLTPPEITQNALFQIRVGQEIAVKNILNILLDSGFERVAEVDEPGQFAGRGGIIDIFAPLSTLPVRIELDGNRIDSIRQFDVVTQQSNVLLKDADIVLLSPDKIVSSRIMTSTIYDYMKNDVVEILVDADSPYGAAADKNPAAKTIRITFLPAHQRDSYLNFNTSPAGRQGGTIGFVMEHLQQVICNYKSTYIFCPTSAECNRIAELARDYKISTKSLQFTVGRLGSGFYIDDTNTAVLTANELFDRRERPPVLKEEKTLVTDFFDIEAGDYCVHADHGICKFLGTEFVTKGKRRQEVVVLQFRDDAKLYVPAAQFGLIQKYIGGKRPHLSKLGTPSWENRKRRVKNALQDIAKDLLRIQAHRMLCAGIAYPADTNWQRAFEASFIFEETIDQIKTTDMVKKDMESSRPMDRLIAGDVGYGKTEIAMRAAFKAVEFGKQVAVLVPTTVLAEQHLRTFKERMAEYPFFMEALSRFKSPAEQREIIEKVGQGEIDILIGTHRILSADVHFADLGLVIIDEEQRFGVAHKEHLKSLRKTVDIMTLTATPIPRTLNMALVGVKDISTLATPPRGREAIITKLLYYDEAIIKESIRRELERGGQVYFVHNRVADIEEVRSRLEELVPEAIFATVHGQMDETLLESNMLDFLNRKIDVLVCAQP